MSDSTKEMILALQSVSDHISDETDKGIINNCVLLIKELSYNERFLLRRLTDCHKYLSEYRQLLYHINGIRNNQRDGAMVGILEDMCTELHEALECDKIEKEQTVENKDEDW